MRSDFSLVGKERLILVICNKATVGHMLDDLTECIAEQTAHGRVRLTTEEGVSQFN